MKLLRSFVFAWNGIKLCFTSDVNFKIHIVLTATVTALGFLFGLAAAEWFAVIGCIALVVTLEMVNTAIEKLCDIVHKDIHPEIKAVKDIAAGAVVVAAFCSMLIGMIIFLPKIIAFIKIL